MSQPVFLRTWTREAMPERVDKSFTFIRIARIPMRNRDGNLTFVVFKIFDYGRRERVLCDVCDIHRDIHDLGVMDQCVQEPSVDYLDLATKNSVGPYWERRVLAYIANKLPTYSREHFLEMKILPFYYRGNHSLLYRIYKPAILDRRIDARGYVLPKFYAECYDSFTQNVKEIRSNEDMTTEEMRQFIIQEIELFLGVVRHYLVDKYSVFHELLNLCTEPLIDSSALVVEMLKSLFVSLHERAELITRLPNVSTLKLLLYHSKRVRFDFWGLMRGTGELAGVYNPVVSCMSTDDQHFYARILLQCGFRYTYQPRVYETQGRSFHGRRYNGRGTANYAYYILEHYQSPGNPIRMMLAIDILHAFVRVRNRNKKITTLVRLLRSIPDPYLTPDELHKRISPVVCHRFLPDLIEVCDSYSMYNFEGDHRILQPRQLRHLCRCKIRDVLADNLKLPEGIRKLNLPRTYKEYLRLEH